MCTNSVVCPCQRSDVEGFNMCKSCFNCFTVGFSSRLPCASAPEGAVFLSSVGISKGVLCREREGIFSHKSGRKRAGEGL